eukprot:708359-Hanusia_phi.AAC.1
MRDDPEPESTFANSFSPEQSSIQPSHDALAASLEKVGALSVDPTYSMGRSDDGSQRRRHGGGASAIMTQLSLASEHAREIVGSILDGRTVNGEGAMAGRRSSHSPAGGLPSNEFQLASCQAREEEEEQQN